MQHRKRSTWENMKRINKCWPCHFLWFDYNYTARGRLNKLHFIHIYQTSVEEKIRYPRMHLFREKTKAGLSVKEDMVSFLYFYFFLIFTFVSYSIYLSVVFNHNTDVFKQTKQKSPCGAYHDFSSRQNCDLTLPDNSRPSHNMAGYETFHHWPLPWPNTDLQVNHL